MDRPKLNLRLTNDTDAELLKRLKSGSQEAFEEIYDKYWYKVFDIAYKRLGRKDVAEELTQNLFLKLWEKRDRIEIATLENYLSVSIKNATIDHIQQNLLQSKYTKYFKAFAPSSCNSTAQDIALADLSEAIDKGLHLLPEKTRAVFRLNRLDHWPVEKIAVHLGLAEKTVGYHLTKSLKFIRSYLKDFVLVVIFAYRFFN